MRISYLTITALSLSFTAAPAFASCGTSPTCSSGYAYGNTAYTSNYRAPAANCPTGTSPSSDGTCLINSGSSSYTSSSSYSTSYSAPTRRYTSVSAYNYTPSSSAPAHYAGHSSLAKNQGVVSGMSDHTADMRYGSGSISSSYTDGSNTIVPFSTRVSNLSNYRMPGMGANEFLSPTQCPVSVFNPDGGKVMGCYSVSKPAPVRIQMPTYRTVRIVRPIVYVRYPVPVAVPVPVYQRRSGFMYGGGYTGGCSGSTARYGNNWPGRPCGS